MLVKKSNRAATPAGSGLNEALSGRATPTRLDRRSFLKRSGLTAGAGAIGASLPFAMVKPAEAAKSAGAGDIVVKRTICTHCSVGCAIDAEVKNGVWVGQEPVFDSPINLGAHCAKGASVREHGHGEHRLRTPMKLSGGKWVRMSWEDAVAEVGDKLMAIRDKHGADATHWIGSSKHSNEQAYLFCKFVALFGTNNMDHQARVCHSTTVAGVANTWGYGAMTNSYNDMQNAKAIFFIGSNAAEAHPVSMLHILHAKEGGAKVIVADPRYTRTAAKSDQYVRLRSGSDIPLIYGVMRHIFENGWEDKKYIEDRVYGMDQIRAEAMEWTADKVFEVTGVPDAEVRQIAETMAMNRPSTVVWCMGQTQHTVGNAITRMMCDLQLVLGNVGIAGGGTNIFRGHDNVQGATDIGPNPDSLPGYYGLSTGAWKHWAAVWGVDYEWIKARFVSQDMMEKPGITVSRWIDGVTENPELVDQATNIKAQIFWGMAPNSQTRGKDMLEAMKALEMLVVVDPYPSATAAMAASVRSDGVYLLPAATQFETYGSVTASNRSLQWREKVIEPLFESKPDHTIMYAFAKKFGFANELCKNIKIAKDAKGWDEPDVEDTLREINLGTWTIGYSGQSPERLKLHMQNMSTFNPRTLKAEGGPCDGDYFGLPWPCWGNPELKHPGSPNLYDTTRHVMNGGGNFRARFGVEKDGVSLLAGEGSSSLDADLKMGYPEFDHVLMKKLGWWDELTEAEKTAAEGKNWKTDLSGGMIRVIMKNHGCMPYGNAKARAVVWNFPDAVPKHREPLYSTRADLVDKYPTHEDKKTHWRLPTLYKTVQDKYRDVGKDFPLIMTSGRLVEYEGGGEETRSNPWLAELQQDMFVELNPRAAADRGIVDQDWVWVKSPTGAQLKVRALVTPRVGPDTVFLPFHFSGRWMGEDMLKYYPEGAAPIVRGEAVNTATTYGYDVVTMMQESKSTVCQVMKA